MNLSVDLKGLEGVIARLAPLSDRDMFGIMLALDAKAKQQVAQTFSSATDPMTGAAWKPTSKFTLDLRPSGGGATMNASGGAGLLGSIIGRAPQVTSDSAAIGTNKIYGPPNQNGATIRPVKAKALAIPLTKEAARFKSPRLFPRKLFVLGGHGPGSGVLAEALGGNRKGVVRAQYVFKQSVTIPQRRFLGVSRNGPNYAGQLEKTVADMISKIIKDRGIGGNIKAAWKGFWS